MAMAGHTHYLPHQGGALVQRPLSQQQHQPHWWWCTAGPRPCEAPGRAPYPFIMKGTQGPLSCEPWGCLSARISGGAHPSGAGTATSGPWTASGVPLRRSGGTSVVSKPAQRSLGLGGPADVAAELANQRDSSTWAPQDEGSGGLKGRSFPAYSKEASLDRERGMEHAEARVSKARGRKVGGKRGVRGVQQSTEPQQVQVALPRIKRNLWRRSPSSDGSAGDTELAAELAGDLAGAISGRPPEAVGSFLDSLAHTLAPQDLQHALGRLQSWDHALETVKWSAQKGGQWRRRQRKPGASPWGVPGASPGAPGAGKASPLYRGPHALHLALLDCAADLDRGRHFGDALEVVRGVGQERARREGQGKEQGQGQQQGERQGEGEGGAGVAVPERQQARLVQRLTAKGRGDLALELLAYACQGESAPAVSVARALVGGLQSQGDVEGVVTAVRRIAEAGGRDASPFNTALSMLSQRGQHRRALDILLLMQRHDVPMDGYTLSSSLAALGRAGRVDEAQALLRKSLDSQDEGVPVVACTTMLGILERAGRAEECVPLLAHMRAGGLEAWDEAAFTTALNCLGRAGMLEEAQELLADMKRLGVPVNRRHTLGLVTMYGRHKDLRRVAEAVREALEGGIPLDEELEVQIRRAAKGAVSHVEARGREQTRTHRRLLLLASARNAPARQRQAMQRVWEHRTLPREGASAVRLLAELEDLLGVLRTHRWRPTPAWAEVLSRLQMMDAATDLPPNLHWLYLAVTGIEDDDACEGVSSKTSPQLAPERGEAEANPPHASGPDPPAWQSEGVPRPAIGDAWAPSASCEAGEASEGGGREQGRGVREPVGNLGGSEALESEESEARQLQLQRRSIPEFFWFSCVARHKRAKRWAQARAAYQAMQRAGVAPEQQTLCAMIEVYGALGDVESAEEAMRLAASPDMATLHVMMQVYAAQGRADDARALFDQMETSPAMSPDLQSYTILLTAYHRAARGADALALFRRMQEHGCQLDEVAANTVINTCGAHMAVEEALGLLRAMQRRNQRPNQVTLNHVLGLLVKAGRMEDAQELFEELSSRGTADSVAFCTMADAYGKRRQLERMEGVVRDAAAHGHVSLPLLNATLDAYGKAGLLGNLRNALQRIKSFNLAPDLTSYNILVHAYGMSGMLAEMEETVHQLKDSGYAPDQYTYNILISAYGEVEMPYASLRTLQEMQDSSMVPDVVTYRNLINAFERAGDYLEAARWSMWAKQVTK